MAYLVCAKPPKKFLASLAVQQFLSAYQQLLEELIPLILSVGSWQSHWVSRPFSLPKLLHQKAGAEEWQGRVDELLSTFAEKTGDVPIATKEKQSQHLEMAAADVVRQVLANLDEGQQDQTVVPPAPVVLPAPETSEKEHKARGITIDTRHVEYERDFTVTYPKQQAAQVVRGWEHPFGMAKPESGRESSDEASIDAKENVGTAKKKQSSDEVVEQRWINAALKDHEEDQPLVAAKEYHLEFSVDVKRGLGSSASLPDSKFWFEGDEEVVELTVQLDSRDFTIPTRILPLFVPRTGKSRGSASFAITPLQEGRGTLTATFLKQGNFLQQMEIVYSIGEAHAAPTSTTTVGRPFTAIEGLPPRKAGLTIKPSKNCEGYQCITWGAVSTDVVLPFSKEELGDAIDEARAALLQVVNQVDAEGKTIFQAGLDIPAAERDIALRTLADAGARLFQRIFYHVVAGADASAVGDWLRDISTTASEPITIQILGERFPIPWGMLYLDEVNTDAPPDWERFLGMRHVIEQIPLQTKLYVRQTAIISDKPSLSVSVNVNTGIDAQMSANYVQQQRDFWKQSKSPTQVRVAERERRAELITALNKPAADDQLMYLYCHAKASGLNDAKGIDGSLLVLSNNERVTLRDLNLKAPISVALGGNPLVFINACESAELSPTFYDGFVPYFMAKGARGVIGTECETPALFAHEWALRFFPRFLSGDALGKTFLTLRREFMMDHGNPLGLLYAMHCNGDTCVHPAVALN